VARQTALSVGDFMKEPQNTTSVVCPVIRFTISRDKPLDELVAADVPRGLDPDDVCALGSDGTLMLTRTSIDS
jgi:hypothetical protein